jgi:hypothetical protein
MGKRSDFPRMERDFYPTPRSAVIPLLPHLPPGTRFAEPCAGAGALIDILQGEGHKCVWATDVAPQRPDVAEIDALEIKTAAGADMVITNPPWSRSILHPIIDHLSKILPCWLLFDADWAHTKQSAELIQRCAAIVSVGRVKWIEGSKHTGKDNACWYLFLPNHTEGPKFVGRQK